MMRHIRPKPYTYFAPNTGAVVRMHADATSNRLRVLIMMMMFTSIQAHRDQHALLQRCVDTTRG